MLAGTFLSIISTGYFESHEDQSTRLSELFNEVIIVLTLYTMICFTTFLPNEMTQFGVGYLCCFLVLVHLLTNLLIMLVGSIKKLILNLKKFYN
jgi:hypothetical protein